MWKILEEIAARFDLKIEYGNVVHLKQGLFKREIASIHDIGLENDIAINPSYERGVELLRELSMRLFGASANGPMDRIAVA